MILNKCFDYKPLDRVDSPDGRKYIVGETKLPSVTTILSATTDKSFLDEWILRVGPAEAARIRDESSTLGTGMHLNLENYILGKPMVGQYMTKALAKVIADKGLSRVDEVWGTEVGLYSTDLYAGTTDLVGKFDGVPAIMDFKNSLKLKEKSWITGYFLQLAAYAMAHNSMYGTTINKGVIMIATREGKYQEFIIEGSEFTEYETKWANTVCDYYNLLANKR